MIHIQYFMKSDMILSAGDRTKAFYIILHGQVKVIDVVSDSLVAELTEGDYFGETTILFPTQHRRAANMISDSITKAGCIDCDNFNVLMEAYPTWKEALIDRCELRINQIFQAANSSSYSSPTFSKESRYPSNMTELRPRTSSINSDDLLSSNAASKRTSHAHNYL
jgi:signal-transduction protein with cAMP-binding, CBS, and nucleotidyltransferase domain